jgi:hypothetical protein
MFQLSTLQVLISFWDLFYPTKRIFFIDIVIKIMKQKETMEKSNQPGIVASDVIHAMLV